MPPAPTEVNSNEFRFLALSGTIKVDIRQVGHNVR